MNIINKNYDTKKAFCLFVDSASISDLKKAVSWGCFSGVTTNPQLVCRETSDYLNHLNELIKIIPDSWELSAMAWGTHVDEIVKAGLRLLELDPRIRIKIPATQEGITAVSKLINSCPTMKLNITCILTPAAIVFCEAIVTKNPNCEIVASIFCDRQRSLGIRWQDTMEIVATRFPKVRILACSLKTPADLWEASCLGASILTAPLSVYTEALSSCIADADLQHMAAPFISGDLSIPLE